MIVTLLTYIVRLSIFASMQPSQQLVTNLITSNARFTRLVRRISGNQASAPTWRALSILDEHGPLRVSEFAALDQLSQPSATTLLRRLEDEGLLTRAADPDDGRASVLRMTAAGTQELARLRARATDAMRPVLSGLRADQLELLDAASAILSSVLDDAATPPERQR